jgi:pyridoxal phosphate enzyme (YggS family)
MLDIQSNIKDVKENVLEACKKSGREIEEITIIAVTKTRPIAYIAEAVKGGLTSLGENKVQEIRDKYPLVSEAVSWHMIGHLQSNKVKYIIDKVDLIHSVDSLKLAETINEQAIKHNKKAKILLQINIGKESTKFGIDPEETLRLIKTIAPLTNVQIEGLMAVAPYVENPEENRLLFRKMRQIFVDMGAEKIDNVNMNVLSMGMTNDYGIAIEEGSTMIRVGTALFGERDYSQK